MNFVNVGQGNGLNTGVAPVLASAFSEVFQVYSAKRFPGVIESTPLSKRFATQGAWGRIVQIFFIFFIIILSLFFYMSH